MELISLMLTDAEITGIFDDDIWDSDMRKVANAASAKTILCIQAWLESYIDGPVVPDPGFFSDYLRDQLAAGTS